MAVQELTRAILEMAYSISMSSTDTNTPRAIMLLVFGAVFLTGFAAGITVEQFNLATRERQLARRRRLLAAQARGVRQQFINFYRIRDAAPDIEPPHPSEIESWYEG